MKKRHLWVFPVALVIGIVLLVPDTRTSQAAVVKHYSHAMNVSGHEMGMKPMKSMKAIMKKRLAQKNVCAIFRMKDGSVIAVPVDFAGMGGGGTLKGVRYPRYGLYGNCGNILLAWSFTRR